MPFSASESPSAKYIELGEDAGKEAGQVGFEGMNLLGHCMYDDAGLMGDNASADHTRTAMAPVLQRTCGMRADRDRGHATAVPQAHIPPAFPPRRQHHSGPRPLRRACARCTVPAHTGLPSQQPVDRTRDSNSALGHTPGAGTRKSWGRGSRLWQPRFSVS